MLSVGKAWRNNDGFTLIELIIVIILVGLLAALSGPAIGNSLSSVRLNTATRHLAAILRKTRSQAIADKQNYKMIFTVEATSYNYPTGSGSKSVSLPKGVKIKKLISNDMEEILSEGLNIYFYPKGNSNGGGLVLENEREQAFYIKIEAVSGRVKISKGNGEDEEE